MFTCPNISYIWRDDPPIVAVILSCSYLCCFGHFGLISQKRGVGWSWMELDGVGWSWMELDGVGWSWMELDGVGWSWICWILMVQLSSNYCRFRQGFVRRTTRCCCDLMKRFRRRERPQRKRPVKPFILSLVVSSWENSVQYAWHAMKRRMMYLHCHAAMSSTGNVFAHGSPTIERLVPCAVLNLKVTHDA